VRTVEGSQYPIHCRKIATDGKFDESQPEEILLDGESAGRWPAIYVRGSDERESGWIFAGRTRPTIPDFGSTPCMFRDLEDREGPRRYRRTNGSVVWAADSQTLFYTTEDEVTKRHDHLFRHRLGDASAQDVVVYEEADERFNLGVGKTRDGKYLLMEAGSHTTNECRFHAADAPEGEFQTIARGGGAGVFGRSSRRPFLHSDQRSLGRTFAW